MNGAASFGALAVAGAIGVALTQPGLATTLHDAKAKEDVYVLLPPAQLKVATLGHEAATVDLLWAKLLVDWGTRFSEKRPFPDVFHYLDTILELEPNYAPLYLFCDTLILYRNDGGQPEDARRTRDYLERGTRERPGDPEVWLHYGQFLAYMSASYLPPGPELDEFKSTGALALTKAVDLGSDATRSLSAATLLAKYGKSDAAIRALRRAYALTDDPQEQQEIAAKLSSLQADAERDEAEEDGRFIEGEWRAGAPFMPRAAFLLVGPMRDPRACAGPGGSFARECAPDWTSALPSAQIR